MTLQRCLERSEVMEKATRGNGPNTSPRASRRWRAFRWLLGFAQIGAAVFSVTLVVRTGINRWSLGSAIATCALTTISVLLFGGLSRGRISAEKSRDAERQQPKRGQAALMENVLRLTEAPLPKEEDGPTRND